MTTIPPRYLLQDCEKEEAWRQRYDTSTARPLGQGACGCVFAITDRFTKSTEAVKVFKGVLDEHQREMVVAEGKNAGRIPSDLIVRAYPPHFGEHASWMAMEYVEGTDLRTYIESRGSELLLEQRLALATTAVEAVHAAHERKVLHRDIKPSNYIVLASPPPLLKLTDFGISKLLDAGNMTATGMLKGTPEWAAPEISKGVRPSMASDVYSLTMVVHWILAGGQYPYELPVDRKPDSEDFFRLARDGHPRDLREFVPEISENLHKVIAAGLDKHPQNRPPVGRLLEALKAEAHYRPEVSPPVTTAPRKLPFGRLAGAAALGVAVLGAVVMFAGRRGGDEGRAGTLPSGSPPITTASAPPSTTATNTAIAAPPALRVGRDNFGVTIANVTKESATQLKVTLYDGAGKEFSADGGALEPGQEITVLFAGLNPPAPDGFRPARGQVTALFPHAKRYSQPLSFAEDPLFTASSDGLFLTVTNTSKGIAQDLAIEIVGTDGRTRKASSRGPLESGGQSMIPLDEFSPEPGAGFQLVSIRVSADVPGRGRQTVTLQPTK